MDRPTILLINPMFNVASLIKTIIDSGKATLNYCIAISANTEIPQQINLEQYTDHVTVIDLKKDQWNFDLKFVTAIAFDYSGQLLLETLGDQILLKNPGVQDFRLSKFLPRPPNAGEILIETISYQGRHVVVAGWEFQVDKHLKLVTNFDSSWEDLIESAFSVLDTCKIINGPGQIYFDLNKNLIGIKLHPGNIPYATQKLGTSRYWADIWQTITAVHSTNPISAQRKFYDWIDDTGTAKTYKATPLTL